ncbi:MAG: PD40 domain-containing protein, partial [Candidatus Sericytochromatia bacterium]|nr:PD40 domain-containing protein [Candidatus Tanganyikabacteria bacterium]
MARHFAKLFAVFSFSLALAQPSFAAESPRVKQWTVLETPHFSVHYNPGEERTARRFAEAAEDVLPSLEKDFGIEVRQRIPVIVDRSVFFNGQAEPIKDRIYLDPVLASSSVIGAKRFIAHELAHVITFLALAKDGTLSKLSNLSGLPTWFLEGIAQYEGEYWMTSNDRMLRLHTLDDSLLTASERENFPLLGSEFGAAGYNEGYSLTKYIFDTYGRDKIAKIFKMLREGQEPSLSRALGRVTGQNLDAIQAAWENTLKERYHKQTIDLKAEVPGSKVIVPSVKGEANVHPRLSPDGKRLAYLSSRHQDSYLYLRGHVMGFLSLMVADPDGRNGREIPMGKGRTSTYAWSPDGKQLVLSVASEDEQSGDPAFNLFVCDADGKNGKQLTRLPMATDPAWKPGGSEVAFVSAWDGKASLKSVDVKTGKVRDLDIDFGDRLIAGLAWSPDGKRLVGTSYLSGEGGKLIEIDVAAGTYKPLTDGGERLADVEPEWSPDGRSIVFASNRDGMENLYRLDLVAGKLFRLTDTYTGASRPHLAADGKTLVWSGYRATGSEIRTVELPAGKPVSYDVPSDPLPTAAGKVEVAAGGPAAASDSLSPAASGSLSLAASGSLSPAASGSLSPASSGSLSLASSGSLSPAAGWFEHAYEPRMTNDIIMPQVTSDERGQQLGVMALYSDILDKQQLGLDVRFGLMSQRFSYSVSYVNRMLRNPWALSLFDAPTVGIPDRLDKKNLAGSLYWERQRGLRARTQLGQFTLGTTMSYINALTQPDRANAPSVGRIREGRLNSVSVGWGERIAAPT